MTLLHTADPPAEPCYREPQSPSDLGGKKGSWCIVSGLRTVGRQWTGAGRAPKQSDDWRGSRLPSWRRWRAQEWRGEGSRGSWNAEEKNPGNGKGPPDCPSLHAFLGYLSSSRAQRLRMGGKEPFGKAIQGRKMERHEPRWPSPPFFSPMSPMSPASATWKMHTTGAREGSARGRQAGREQQRFHGGEGAWDYRTGPRDPEAGLFTEPQSSRDLKLKQN